ncbi:hypothetical protein B0H63DRAFT_228103 [Podospora didyma]|uniref:C3H1-type domain-containing protein n=1 Tax=Podospora didyma TaxID=330526 RepID=A0AAE0KL15_9PEZI|nr:hypothetical protein B0H63DRAFT_228103 [Podospora didyma]
MDPNHGNGISDWDAANFSTEAWDHQFTEPGLGFDHNGVDVNVNVNHHGYHHNNPNAFLNPGSQIQSQIQSQIHPQLAGSESEQGLYHRPYSYYSSNDVWSGTPTATATSPYGQPYYAEQQAPNDTSRNTDSRFALVDLPPNNEFQHHHVHDSHEAASHAFANGVVNTPNQAPNGYISGPAPHWQQRPQASASAYGATGEYENPLAAAQTINIQAQGPRGSTMAYSSGNRTAQPGAIQGYEAVSHQAVDARQNQSQFVQVPNGQPLQPRPPVAQLPASVNNGSPHVASQLLAQNAMVSQPASQQVSRQPPQNQTLPAQPPVVQPRPVQPHVQQHAQNQAQLAQQQAQHYVQQPAQQPVQHFSPSTENSVSNLKRRPPSEIQEPTVVAKKVKVLAIAPTAGSPSASTPAPQPDNSVPSNYFSLDKQLIEEASGRKGGTLKGVPNLVIGDTPVKLKKGPPTKRYVVLSAKGDRDPLFPDLPCGWTPAESLGNHLTAYQSAKQDLDRQTADTRLDIELKRTGNEIPADWWKKLPKADGAVDVKRMDPPPEPVNTTIQAAESLRLHPSHQNNRRLLSYIIDDYWGLLDDKISDYRTDNSPIFEKIVKGLKMRAKTPASFPAAEEEALKLELQMAGKQLECAFQKGLEKGDARVFRQLGEKTDLPTRILNILIRHINLNDTKSSFVKMLLRFFSRFTTVKRSKLDSWKFPSIAKKLDMNGDAEVKKLVAAIFSNADENDESDSSASDAKSTSKGVGSAAEKKKAVVTKGVSKVPAATSGSKRPREDDAGGETRNSKKAATESTTNGPVASAKAPSTTSKPVTSKTSIITAAPASSAAQPKPRTGLLLPGKIRPTQKAMQKPEPPKTEVPKSLVKSAAVPKSQPIKTEASKPPALKPQTVTASTSVPAKAATKTKTAEAPPSSSRFAALLAEISEPKKVTAPVRPSVAPPDPNETKEQRERRLRKEERRRLNLKVTFRSEDRLVEIREFTRDPEEIAFSQSHGAHNVDKMEGMALRKGHAGEIHGRTWEEPNAIDLDIIPQEKRQETFATRGGIKTFTTEQQKFMEDREAKELMVVYTTPSDIPPTPKSPPHQPATLDVNPADAIQLPETPDCAEVSQRARDCTQWGLRRAIHDAQMRLDARSNPDYANFEKALKSVTSIATNYDGNSLPRSGTQDKRDALGPEYRDQQTYQLLISERVKNYKDPEPYDAVRPRTVRRHEYPNRELQKAADIVEDVVEQLRRAQSVQPVEPAHGPTPKQKVALPVPAISQPAQAAPDYSAAWAQYYAQQNQQQLQQQQQAWYAQQQSAYTQPTNPYVQPQAQAQPSQPANPQQNPDSGNQLSAILAALGNQGQSAQSQYPSADSVQALIAALNNPQTQQAAVPAAAADPQNAEYLLSVLKWAAAGQNQAAGNPSGPAPTPAPYTAHSIPPSQGVPYGSGGQGYGSLPLQERDSYSNNNSGGNRDRDRDHHHHSRGNNGKSNSGNQDIPDHLRGINRSLIGTKQCTFWARGQCAKGDKCTFRHD